MTAQPYADENAQTVMAVLREHPDDWFADWRLAELTGIRLSRLQFVMWDLRHWVEKQDGAMTEPSWYRALPASGTTKEVSLRRPCDCGCGVGSVLRVGKQATVRCADCDRYQYNASRSELGEAPASLATRKGIKPAQRFRAMLAYGSRCYLCGVAASEAPLEIDHIIPVAEASKHGLHDELIDSDDNLAPLCAACNIGKSDKLDVRLVVRALAIRHQMDRDKKGNQTPW